MAVVLDNMAKQNLGRAHIITAFFWAGVGSGHRLRRAFDATGRPGKALFENSAREREDPFCVGFCFGWLFEEGKDDGK